MQKKSLSGSGNESHHVRKNATHSGTNARTINWDQNKPKQLQISFNMLSIIKIRLLHHATQPQSNVHTAMLEFVK